MYLYGILSTISVDTNLRNENEDIFNRTADVVRVILFPCLWWRTNNVITLNRINLLFTTQGHTYKNFSKGSRIYDDQAQQWSVTNTILQRCPVRGILILTRCIENVTCCTWSISHKHSYKLMRPTVSITTIYRCFVA